MPIHDWTKAPPGYFHHFHQRWTGTICDALNAGLLPKGMFALLAQRAGPPKTRFVSRGLEEEVYAAKANRVVVYGDDETIAVIEIVSPGNKSSAHALRQFVEKSLEYLERGIHLLAVDLLPQTPRDPQGIHAAIWIGINPEPFTLPTDKPLTLASYVGGLMKVAYVEPVAVGDILPQMPVFLDAKLNVRLPLEETYELTWKACPEEFRERVTGSSMA